VSPNGGDLDPQVRAFIAEVEAAGAPPLEMLTPADARALQAQFVPQLAGAPEAVARVVEREIAGPGGRLPVRVYAPAGEALGALVWYHGGGFTIGGLDTADPACRALARRANCVVVSVGYRLAPEHPFPAAVDDACAAARWVAENAADLGYPSGRLAVGGDSGGGTLAIAATFAARDGAVPQPCFQLLVYPATGRGDGTPSYARYGAGGYLLTASQMDWFWRNYLPREADAADPRACPERAESLRGLPPAFVLLATCDPLHDEGRAYAGRLERDGVAVRVAEYGGMIHGFFTMPGVFDRARVAYDDAAAALRAALSAG
jgi:acetyl esterase